MRGEKKCSIKRMESQVRKKVRLREQKRDGHERIKEMNGCKVERETG